MVKAILGQSASPRTGRPATPSFRAAMIALLVTRPASAWQGEMEAGITAGGRLWAPPRQYLISNILIIWSPRRSKVRTKPGSNVWVGVHARAPWFEPLRSSNVSITWGASHHQPRVLGAGVLRSPGRSECGRGSCFSRHDAGCARPGAPLPAASRPVNQRDPHRAIPWPFGAQDSLSLSLGC